MKLKNNLLFNLTIRILMKFQKKFWMKLYFKFNKTALHLAVEKGIPQIVQFLIKNESINANTLSILNHYFWIKFQVIIFNSISNNFKYNYHLWNFISFQKNIIFMKL